jgi:hypothetical protein
MKMIVGNKSDMKDLRVIQHEQGKQVNKFEISEERVADE